MALMAEFVGVLLMLTGLVWASAEGVGLAFGKPKRKVAMIAGPLVTVLATGRGLIPGLEKDWWSWALAIVLGFMCTLGAGALNDWLVNPLKKRFTK